MVPIVANVEFTVKTQLAVSEITLNTEGKVVVFEDVGPSFRDCQACEMLAQTIDCMKYIVSLTLNAAVGNLTN